MIIECTACHARARIPESKEGAKVRCSECGHVYVARDPQARRKKGPDGTVYFWVGVGLVVLVVGFVLMRGGAPEERPVQAPEVEIVEGGPAIDFTGWDSAPVKALRDFHDAVYLRDAAKVERLLDLPRLYADLRGERELDEHAGDGASLALRAALWPEGPPAAETWDDLDASAQDELQGDVVEWLLSGEGARMVSDWKPFDGEVVEDGEVELVVRVSIAPREGVESEESRNLEWRLARDGERFRAWAWERWWSPAELKNRRVKRSRKYEAVTLSDGSKVIEGEVEPLEHLPETPPEQRAEIERLYAKMIDLSISPKDADGARDELIEIGRPAIPRLLTGFYEIPLETEEQTIQVNIIVQALRQITGQNFGYKPQVNEGSAMGTTDERRSSALKQWYGWWYRTGQRKFTEKELGEDLLDQTVTPSEREQREIERLQRSDKP